MIFERQFSSLNYRKQFLLFWISALLIYFPTYHGGFYEDFQGIITRDRGLGWVDYLFRSDRRVPDLYLGNLTINYILYKSFGTNPVPWYIVFATLHALNVIIIKKCFTAIFDWFGCGNMNAAVLIGLLFWFFSPIHVETINWKACVHYLIAVSLLFLVLRYFLNYLRYQRKPQLIAALLIYALSTLFWEIFYITPLLCLLLLCFSLYITDISPKTLLKRGLLAFALFAVIFGLYYFALILYSNHYIARVDSVAFENITLHSVGFKLCGYFSYIYFMEYLLPSAFRAKFIALLYNSWFQVAFLGSFATAITLGLLKIKNIKPATRLTLFLFIAAIGCICILIPMPYPELFPYTGGRYFYPGSVFFYMALSLFLFIFIKRKLIRNAIIVLYLAFSIFGLSKMILNVYYSNKIFYGLMNNFEYANKDTVVLLNLPTSLKGIGLMGADKNGNLGIHTDMFLHRKNSCKEYNVSGYNMVSRWDGAHVKVLDSLTLKVTLNQYGAWWWYEGFGAYDYENELYAIKFIDNGFSYLLNFKQRPSNNTAVLFQKDSHWYLVDMNKKNTEQW